MVLAWFSVWVMAWAFASGRKTMALSKHARLGGVDAPDGEKLLAHIAVGGVDRQVELVADFQAQFFGQRLADQDAFPVIGSEEFAADQAFPVRSIGLRSWVDANNPDPGRLVAGQQRSRWQTGAAWRRSPAPAWRSGQPPESGSSIRSSHFRLVFAFIVRSAPGPADGRSAAGWSYPWRCSSRH